MVQAHIFAHGRVQGVGFRYHVRRRATGLNLKGFVRNLLNEQVEIEVQGPQEDVEEFIKYIRGNPGLSYVVKLDIIWEDPLSGFEDFHIEI